MKTHKKTALAATVAAAGLGYLAKKHKENKGNPVLRNTTSLLDTVRHLDKNKNNDNEKVEKLARELSDESWQKWFKNVDLVNNPDGIEAANEIVKLFPGMYSILLKNKEYNRLESIKAIDELIRNRKKEPDSDIKSYEINKLNKLLENYKTIPMGDDEKRLKRMANLRELIKDLRNEKEKSTNDEYINELNEEIVKCKAQLRKNQTWLEIIKGADPMIEPVITGFPGSVPSSVAFGTQTQTQRRSRRSRLRR